MAAQRPNPSSHSPPPSGQPSVPPDFTSDFPPLNGNGLDSRSFVQVAAMEETPVPKPFIDFHAQGLIAVDYVKDNRLEPRIVLSSDLKERLNQPWSDALIVKLLGRNVGYIALRNKVMELWQPRGEVEITDVGYGFHVVRFQLVVDRDRVMLDGPWTIQGHYLTVRTWSPDFRPALARIDSTMVWARFPNLPMQFFDSNLLLAIGNTFGKAVKVDGNTDKAARGRFARVCVEVDLAKPLVAQFWLEDEVYRVEYEGLHIACTKCGVYGHGKETCTSPSILPVPTNQQSMDVQEGLNIDAQVDGNKGSEETPSIVEAPEYGPWMMVPKRKYNPKNKVGSKNEAGGSFVPNFARTGDKNVFGSGKKNIEEQPLVTKRSNMGKENDLGRGKSLSTSSSRGRGGRGGVNRPSNFQRSIRELSCHNVFGDLSNLGEDEEAFNGYLSSQLPRHLVGIKRGRMEGGRQPSVGNDGRGSVNGGFTFGDTQNNGSAHEHVGVDYFVENCAENGEKEQVAPMVS